MKQQLDILQKQNKNMKVQIEVIDYDKDYYDCEGLFIIPKSICTVISDDTEHEEKELRKEEPKGYYIERIEENSKVLNKWICTLIKDEYKGCLSNKGFVYSANIDNSEIPYTSDKRLEGYTELHTVEEFFTKVGYTPETILCDNKEPLIASNEHIDSIYNPIIKSGRCYVQPIENVIHATYKTLEKVKEIFESNQLKPSTPVPVVQKTTERTLFDLKLWDTGKYDVVQRDGNFAKVIDIDPSDGVKMVAKSTNGIKSYSNLNGIYLTIEQSDYDLFLVAKTETVWVNVFNSMDHKSLVSAKRDIETGFISSAGLKFMETIEITRPIK